MHMRIVVLITLHVKIISAIIVLEENIHFSLNTAQYNHFQLFVLSTGLETYGQSVQAK